MITTWHGCRVCGGRLQTVLDLGSLHVSAFPAPDDPDSLRAPLDLTRCAGCGLVQLRHSVSPGLLYQDYWYRSGVNETMVAELQDIARSALDWVGGVGQPLPRRVVDIGANDGTLLAAYPPEEVTRVAYEPSPTFHAGLQQVADIVVPHAFPTERGFRGGDGLAHIVTSIACVYDVDDPVAFAREVARILAPQGVWIVQFQDLAQMLATTAVDNICHEHVTYLSLAAIERIAARVGLAVVHVQQRAINGGSLRCYLQHVGARTADRSVGAWREQEAGCESVVALERFAGRASERLHQIRQTLLYAVQRGQTIDLYAASTKANTWLQAAEIPAGTFRQAWERSPEKWGRQTVGTRIPIVSEADGRSWPPDLLVLGAWQFAEAFIGREAAYLAAGGTMLVPLPRVEIVQAAGARVGR